MDKGLERVLDAIAVLEPVRCLLICIVILSTDLQRTVPRSSQDYDHYLYKVPNQLESQSVASMVAYVFYQV